MISHDQFVVRNEGGEYWIGGPTHWSPTYGRKVLHFSSALAARLDARPVQSEGFSVWKIVGGLPAEVVESCPPFPPIGKPFTSV